MASTEEVMKNNLKEQLPVLRDNFKFSYEQSDKFVVWIIGSDVAGITLLIANTDKLHLVIGKAIGVVIFLLFLSVVCGLIYKLLSIPLLSRWQRFESDYMVFTMPKERFDVDEDEVDPTFMPKLKKFLNDKLGLTLAKFDKIAKSKKTVYPLGFRANKFFKLSIYLFLIAFTFLVFSYLF